MTDNNLPYTHHRLPAQKVNNPKEYMESINNPNKPLEVGDTVYLEVPPKFDQVNHPPHYNNSQAKCECGRRIECIDITRHLNFNIGNAIKYLWRCDLKNSPVDDLKKAIWYIQDEINNRNKS